MKIKKLGLTALAAALAVGMLAGCGDTGTPSSGEGPSGDPGSRVSGLPETLENGDVSFFLWSEPSDEDKAFFKSFEDKYGGKVTYTVTTWGELEAKISAAIGADNSPDLIWTHEGNYIKNAINKVIAPIDDRIDLNDDLWDPMSRQMTWDGKTYLAIPNGTASEVLVYFNKTMFKNNGVKTPLDYYNEGNWNFETFEECARALTADTTGDGKINQYGWSSWRMFDFVYANGGTIAEVKDGNSADVSMDSTQAKYGFQFLKDAYQKYGYAKPNGNMTYSTDLQSGTVAMVSENAFIGTQLGDMTDEWDVVPFPAGPDNTEKKNIVTALGWGLAANSKNPEGAVAYMQMYAQYKMDSERNQLAKTFSEEQLTRIYDARKNPLPPHVETNFGVWEKSQYSFIFGIANNLDVSKGIEQWSPILKAQIKKTLDRDTSGDE